ncbi:MAG: hypothetical protein SF052_04835 [Bacteroidia bacterium]|nr:hypothetical protein [Bacteroidia bacterium]
MSSLLEIIQNAFKTVLEQMVQVFPRLVGALFLLLIGWILARIISSVVAKLLTRIGIDRLAEKLNNTDSFREMKLTLRPVSIFKGFLYWMILLIFILSATETLGLDILTQQISGLIDYIPQLVTALIILAVGFYISDAIKSAVANTCKSLGISAWKFISSSLFYLLLLIVSVTALSQAGIDTSVITSNFSIILGGIILAFAIAYGFAARNVLSSILTSFYSKNNFEIGQIIELDGYKGTIVKLDNVSFTLDMGDRQVIFPLNRLLTDTIVIHRQKEKEIIQFLND